MGQTIHTYAYDNGLVLLAEPMRALESAAFSILLPAGACYDPAGRSGLAALSTELMLRGSGSRDSRAFVNDLDNLGVERGDAVGAAHTSFSGATLAKNLLPALAIYADLVRRPHLPEDQLEAARSVVLQELQAVEDNPDQKVMLELRRQFYPAPWGQPSCGDEADLEAASLGDIQQHFARGARPNGAILAVAGRVNWDELKQRVGELFADWKPVDATEPEARARGQRRLHLPSDTQQTQIGVAYSSVPYNDAQFFHAWASVGALSGGMSSRLFTEVRERRGLCYSVYASHHTHRDRAAVLCYAGTSNERAQETLDVLLAELVRLGAGVLPAELDRLKARVKSGIIMQQESSAARSGAIARDWYLLGRVRTLDELATIVDAVTAEGINAYLAADPPRDFTVVTLGPDTLETPDGIS